MRKLVPISVVFLVIMGGLWISAQGEEPVKAEYAVESEGLKVSGLEGYSLESRSTEEVAGIQTVEIIASNRSSRLETDVYSEVSSEFAENFIQDRRTELNSLYTDTPAPYEGIPERTVDCGEEYRINVTQVPEQNQTKYSLYADEDYRPGACSEEEVEYRLELVIIYCSSTGTLFESRSFVEGPEQSHPDVSC